MPNENRAATGVWDRRTGDVEDGHSIVTLTTSATIILVCGILYIAKDLFLPLALGMLIAFILTPVVNALRRMGMTDVPAVVMTVLAAASLVGAFLLVLAYQVSQIGANLPQYQGNVLAKIDEMLQAGEGNAAISHLQGMVENIANRLETELPGQAMKVEVVETNSPTDWLTSVILPALAPVGVFGIIFVIVVFALMERAALRDRLVQLIGGSNIPGTSRLLSEAGARVSTYLVAQLIVNVIYAVPIGLGLWVLDVPNALFFALVTLVLRFVPYVGSAISAILPLLMAFAVSPGWSLVLWTGALFLVVELVTSNIIEPWLYGQRTGVSPLAVIVSALFWTWLWGPVGLIVATPLTVCLVVIGRHVPSLRLFQIMLGDQPVLSDSARLYDRLLVGQRFAFTEAATHSTARNYLAEYYDGTAIPALALAQADHQAGLLSDHQTARIAHAAWTLAEELETVVEEELAAASDTPVADGTSLVNNGVLDGIGRTVAVLGAQTGLDDVAAQMVSQVLRAEGAEAIALPRRSPLPASLDGFKPDTLVLLSLDGTPPGSLDLQVRRLRRRLTGVRIGVAVWPTSGTDGGQGIPKGSSDFVVQGMEALLQLAFEKANASAA